MTIDALLAEMEGYGATLTLSADHQPILKGALRVPRELIAELRARREEVIAHLSAEAVALPAPPDSAHPDWRVGNLEELATSILLREMGILLGGIQRGSREGLNRLVPKVQKVHIEAALEAMQHDDYLERLRALGDDVQMAALVHQYKRRLSILKGRQRKGESIDLFMHEAALRLAAVHPQPNQHEPWYQALLDAARETRHKDKALLRDKQLEEAV